MTRALTASGHNLRDASPAVTVRTKSCSSVHTGLLIAGIYAHRSLDPLLGVFTGVFAYYLYENNPRTAPPQQDRLQELITWKRAKWTREQEEKLKKEEDIDWKALAINDQKK